MAQIDRLSLIVCFLGITITSDLLLGVDAGRAGSCDLSKIPGVAQCESQLEADMKSRWPDVPPELKCCIISRLANCLSDVLQGRCPDELTQRVASIRKRMKVTTGCDSVSYPSITCYAYLYRDAISLVMLIILVSFSSYAVIVCCCRCCCPASQKYRFAYGLRPVSTENRPLIIVTH
jgi:hypothetical protein